MKVINRPILLAFSRENPEIADFLEAWVYKIRNENWKSPEDVLATFPGARLQSSNRICFTIEPDCCYVVIMIHYSAQFVIIKSIESFYPHQNLLTHSLADPKGASLAG